MVAGEYHGLRGPVTEIAAQPLYMDVTLERGADFTLSVPEGHTPHGLRQRYPAPMTVSISEKAGSIVSSLRRSLRT